MTETTKTWKVVYQDVPFAHTQPGALLIEAETELDARITAADHLTRKGKAVYDEELKIKGGRTHIRTIEVYTARPKGKVIG